MVEGGWPCCVVPPGGVDEAGAGVAVGWIGGGSGRDLRGGGGRAARAAGPVEAGARGRPGRLVEG